MDDYGRSRATQPTLYVLDTNVLIHDPNALLNFQEHQVAIPMTVLEELDQLKTGKHSVAAECRQAIRLIDKLLGDATPEEVELGVPIQRGKSGPSGSLSILMSKGGDSIALPEDLNDNKIQVATFFTTEAAIRDNGYVMLADPQSMILPQNVVPVVSEKIDEQAAEAIESVIAELSADDLVELNRQSVVDQASSADIATGWLTEKGLL